MQLLVHTLLCDPCIQAVTPSHHSFTYVKVEVITPEDHMGDVIGDLNSRRGMVNKFEDKPGKMKLVSVSVFQLKLLDVCFYGE